MADKKAVVRLTLDKRGLLADLRTLESGSKKVGDRIGSSLGDATKAALKDAQRGLRALGNTKVSPDGLLSGLRTFESKALSTARRVGQAMAYALGGAFGASGRLVKGFGGGLGFGKLAGATAIGGLGADAARSAFGTGAELVKGANRVDELANRLSVSSRQAGKGFVDPKQLTAEFFAVAQEVKGVTGEAAADAAARFVTLTGDLDTARKSLKDFAEVASATGANVGDVAEAAASISQQFGLTDPKEIREVLAALTFQGKQGSFEIKDAAKQYQRLAASGASFGLPKTAGGVRLLGGLTQIARSGTGSGEQAATAIESMFAQLKAKTTQLSAQGVNVYSKGKTRDVREILVDAISKIGGSDIAKKQAGLTSIFGEQGIRAINPLISLYNDTFANTKGDTRTKTLAARGAIDDKILEAADAAGDWNEILKDSAQAQTSNSAKLTAAWETLTAKVSESVLPVLSTFVDDLSKNPEAIQGFTEAISLAGEGLSAFASFIGQLSSGMSAEEYAKTQVAREFRGKETKAKQELASLQMSPEEIAQLEQSDPKKLGRLRGQAILAKIQADTAGEHASRLEQEVLDSQAKHGDGMLGKLASLFGQQAKQGAPPPPPSRKVASEVTNEVRVRVTNPDEVGKSSGPGWGGSSNW
ncbi:phage tail tape measure protein [Sorangium sp. So ce1389]|uniref:phage tail tape measure protein n=1 Tax=Sorangium sp. So ce1389 TaxID=3133336 RepID=UPI003F63D646